MLWSLQVKKALRARGKQPDKNCEYMGEANGETEATGETEAAQPANSKPAVKQPGKGRGKGRGRKASKPVAPAEKEEEVPGSPVKGEGDKRKAGEAVQTPTKPSPNKKAPKKRVPKAKATDGADGADASEQIQESWAAQDWNKHIYIYQYIVLY